MYNHQQHSNLQDKSRILNFQICTIPSVTQQMVTVCLPHSRDSLPSFKVLFCRLSYLHLFCFTTGSVILLIFSDLLPAIIMTVTYFIDSKERLMSEVTWISTITLQSILCSPVGEACLQKFGVFSLENYQYIFTKANICLLFSSHCFSGFQNTLEMWPQSIWAKRLKQHTSAPSPMREE